MADLAELGIRVRYEDPKKSEKRLKDLEEQAKRTARATSKLGKGKASDGLAKQSKVANNIAQSYARLGRSISDLNLKYEKMKDSPKALSDLKKELNRVDAAAKKAADSGGMTFRRYKQLARQSDTLRSKINEQSRTLKQSANSIKEADNASKQYIQSLKHQQAVKARIAREKGVEQQRKKELQQLKSAIIQRHENTQALNKQREMYKKVAADYEKHDHLAQKHNQTLKKVNKNGKEFSNVIQEWWVRFGKVAIAFTVVYRLMNAFEQALQRLTQTFMDGIKLSGEMAAQQSKLAAYAQLMGDASQSAEGFAQNLNLAENNVRALAKESLSSVSSLDELQTAYDEFAQHGLLIGRSLMSQFSAFTDFVSLVAQTTGNTARQIRSEISGLLEGRMRATNVVIRMLKRAGLLSEELLRTIKDAGDASEGLQELLSEIGPTLERMQETLLIRDVPKVWEKWQDALSQAVATAVSYRSKLEGVPNIFGEMINEHRKWAVALQEDYEMMQRTGKAMALLRSAGDLVMSAYEGMITTTINLLATLYDLRGVIKTVAIAFGSLLAARFVPTLLTSVGKAALWLVKSPFTMLSTGIYAVRSAFETMYLTLADLPSKLKRMGAAIGSNITKFLKYATTIGVVTAALYGLTVAIRSISHDVPENFLGNLNSNLDEAQTRLQALKKEIASEKGMLGLTPAKLRPLEDAIVQAEKLIELRKKGMSEEKIKQQFGDELRNIYNVFMRLGVVEPSKEAGNYFDRILDTLKSDAKSISDVLTNIVSGVQDKISDSAKTSDLRYGILPESIGPQFLDIKKQADNVKKEIEKALSDVNITFYDELKEAVKAGRPGKVEELMPFARRELQMRLDELKNKLNEVKDGAKGLVPEETQLKIEQLKYNIKDTRKELAKLDEQKAMAVFNQEAAKLDTRVEDIYNKHGEGTDKAQREINDLVDNYRAFINTLGITGQEVEKLRQRLKELAGPEGFEKLNEVFSDYAKQSTDKWGLIANSAENALSRIEDDLTDFIMTGKYQWKDFADFAVRELTRIMVKKNIIGPLSESMSNVNWGQLFSGSAKGNVLAHGRYLEKYATGGIVDKPTVFPMANGAGLMGEKGPEAIMPLERTSSGDLGVKSTGGSVEVNIYNNTSNSNVDVQESQGGKSIDVIIDETVAGKVNQRGSATNRALRTGHRTNIPLTRR